MKGTNFGGRVLAAALGFAVLGPAAFAAAPARSAEATVMIDNFTFNPPRLTVKAGTIVTWNNEDDIPHTVASSAKVFKSKALDTGDKFSFTFATPGEYEYFCSLHPHMTGTIVVEATTGSNAAQ
ncbi:MAG TPA: cupredoxin family copper-binding protein [Xanthobacteraceae bacterium]|jgi:plastocyanin